MKKFFLALTFLITLLAGCASTRPTPQALTTNRAQVLLLGEVHDSADGHRERFAYLQSLIEAGWRPAIGMEQFDRENQTALDAALKSCTNADCILATPGLRLPNWNWDFYKPVLELALRHQLRIIAVNLSRADATQVVRNGFAASFDSATMQARGLDRPLPDAVLVPQREEIIEGHCNKLPANLVTGMTNAQVARDIWMAQLIAPYAAQGVVLLAGNGHVRQDIGVAYWLRQGGTLQPVISIAFGTPAPDQACDFTPK
ncbi:ChaN family lipoprotein [Uliginosibacterium sp. H3]|uniref:ChaN family lipoprotein n=1 Tax=Uliginosibacterium silvisoli TaxID=3114758 RepID=A0ABU6K196_9RHOO|nr:ChaN family lipoprotein [Uliginosibacterium sp. H3]